MVEKIRLQKYLANQGVASRRKCEEYIQKGLVKVNDKIVTELGTKIDPEADKIELEDKAVAKEKANYVYLLLNKPKGYITSLKQSDSNSPLVIDLIPKKYGRVVPAGRLDKDSTGLLLLTNDGELTFKLTHPSYSKEKEYLVTTRKKLTEGVLDKFRKGLKIDNYLTRPAVCKLISETKFSIILKEGRNRQIRKMVQKAGNSVIRLHRFRLKDLVLGDLKYGEFRELTNEEVENLKKD